MPDFRASSQYYGDDQDAWNRAVDPEWMLGMCRQLTKAEAVILAIHFARSVSVFAPSAIVAIEAAEKWLQDPCLESSNAAREAAQIVFRLADHAYVSKKFPNAAKAAACAAATAAEHEGDFRSRACVAAAYASQATLHWPVTAISDGSVVRKENCEFIRLKISDPTPFYHFSIEDFLKEIEQYLDKGRQAG